MHSPQGMEIWIILLERKIQALLITKKFHYSGEDALVGRMHNLYRRVCNAMNHT